MWAGDRRCPETKLVSYSVDVCKNALDGICQVALGNVCKGTLGNECEAPGLVSMTFALAECQAMLQQLML